MSITSPDGQGSAADERGGPGSLREARVQGSASGKTQKSRPRAEAVHERAVAVHESTDPDRCQVASVQAVAVTAGTGPTDVG